MKTNPTSTVSDQKVRVTNDTSKNLSCCAKYYNDVNNINNEDKSRCLDISQVAHYN
jgi:hypothetical protein